MLTQVHSCLVYNIAANIETYTYLDMLLVSVCLWKEMNGMYEFKKLSL